MQGEAGNVARAGGERFVDGGQDLQRQYLATLAGSGGDAVGDGMPDQGIHGIVPFSAHVQIRGLVIAHQQALAFEKAAHASLPAVLHPSPPLVSAPNGYSQPRDY